MLSKERASGFLPFARLAGLFSLAVIGQFLITKNHFLTGFVLLLLGVFFIQWFEKLEVARVPKFPKSILLLLVCVIAAGVFLRLYELTSFPGGIENDEAGEMYLALDAFDWPKIHLFSDWGYRLETLFHYIVATILKVAGHKIVVFRLFSAVLGLLTLGLTFLFARRFFRQEIALAATAILAVLFWHLAYSRVFFRAALTPVIVLAAGLALANAWKKENFRAWLLLGVANLLGFLTYTAYRASFLALFLAVLASRQQWRQKFRAAALGFFTPGVIYLTLVWLIEGSIRVAFERGLYSIQLPKISFARNYLFTLLFFHVKAPEMYTRADTFWGEAVNAILYRTCTLAVPPLTAVLILLGAILGVRLWVRGSFGRRPGLDSGASAILVVLLTYVPLAVLAPAGPSYTRLLVVVPFAAILAGFALTDLLARIQTGLHKTRNAVVLATTVLTFTILGQNLYQTIKSIPENEVSLLYCKDVVPFGEQIAADPSPAGKTLVFVSYCFDTARFLVPRERHPIFAIDNPEQIFNQHFDPRVQTTVYVHGNVRDAGVFLDTLHKRFPKGAFQSWKTPSGTQYSRVILAAGS